MTVQELIDELQQYDPDQEVRFASQPHYPFEYDIDRTLEWDNETHNWREDEKYIDPDDVDSRQAHDDARPDENPVVYLVEGSQLGYLNKDLFDNY